MNSRLWLSALAISAGLCSGALAQVTGSVKLDGEAPDAEEINMKGVPQCAALHADPVYDETVVVGEKGELANVIVFIKKEEGQELAGEIPSKPIVLDQVGCHYVPHVVSCMVGQDFIVKNSDKFLHNIHSLATVNPAFNEAQPDVDPGKKVASPKAEETFKIKCDVHPWMHAFVRVFDHPFFATSGEDGKYSIDIKGVADGEYTLVAWQEKYGEQETKIEVKDGKATADFAFKAGSAKADPAPGMRLVEVSQLGAVPAAGEVKTVHCEACEGKSEEPVQSEGQVVKTQAEQPQAEAQAK